jgi:prevent-host-death family protein
LVQVKTIGIRELRQNASQVVEAAEKGTTYRVTNHGKDTGVVIGRQSHAAASDQKRSGATPEQIAKAGVYDQPRPPGYEQALLEIVERGREQAGEIGDR